MKKSIATIVSGVILSTSLIIGNSLNANHFSCIEIAEAGVKFLKSKSYSERIEIPYGRPGMVSPDEYDKCLIENFEKGAQRYTIKVTKKDPRHFNGTSYLIVKKLRQATI